MSDLFGDTCPRKMPGHFFSSAIKLDYGSAVKGNPDLQTYCVAPRHWYIDAVYRCRRCRHQYTWKAAEQKIWFEEYGLWVDAEPSHCKTCVATKQHFQDLQSEYNSIIASARSHGTTEEKERVIEIVGELSAEIEDLPVKMLETANLFKKQLGI